jgi:hypothetical protein
MTNMTGDARVIIRAIIKGASKADGWELSKDVYNVGIQHIASCGFSPNVNISLHNGDAREANILQYDIITLFLLPRGLAILKPWIINSLKSRNSDTIKSCSPRIVTQGWKLELDENDEAVLRLQRKKTNPITGTELYLYY